MSRLESPSKGRSAVHRDGRQQVVNSRQDKTSTTPAELGSSLLKVQKKDKVPA